MFGPLWTAASALGDRTAPAGAATALALARRRSLHLPFAPAATASSLAAAEGATATDPSAKTPAHRNRPRVAGTATSPDAGGSAATGSGGDVALIQNPRSARRALKVPLTQARPRHDLISAGGRRNATTLSRLEPGRGGRAAEHAAAIIPFASARIADAGAVGLNAPPLTPKVSLSDVAAVGLNAPPTTPRVLRIAPASPATPSGAPA